MRAAAALAGSWIKNKRQNGSKFCGPGLLRWASQPVLNFELADHAGGSVTRRVLGMKTRDNMCLNYVVRGGSSRSLGESNLS